MLRVGEGEVGDKGLENLYVLDLKSLGFISTPLAEGFDKNYIYIGADHGLLYFETTVAAPRGRVVAIAPSSPGSGWSEDSNFPRKKFARGCGMKPRVFWWDWFWRELWWSCCIS